FQSRPVGCTRIWGSVLFQLRFKDIVSNHEQWQGKLLFQFPKNLHSPPAKPVCEFAKESLIELASLFKLKMRFPTLSAARLHRRRLESDFQIVRKQRFNHTVQIAFDQC